VAAKNSSTQTLRFLAKWLMDRKLRVVFDGEAVAQDIAVVGDPGGGAAVGRGA